MFLRICFSQLLQAAVQCVCVLHDCLLWNIISHPVLVLLLVNCSHITQKHTQKHTPAQCNISHIADDLGHSKTPPGRSTRYGNQVIILEGLELLKVDFYCKTSFLIWSINLIYNILIDTVYFQSFAIIDKMDNWWAIWEPSNRSIAKPVMPPQFWGACMLIAMQKVKGNK